MGLQAQYPPCLGLDMVNIAALSIFLINRKTQLEKHSFSSGAVRSWVISVLNEKIVRTLVNLFALRELPTL